jgi:hypothetical protein
MPDEQQFKTLTQAHKELLNDREGRDISAKQMEQTSDEINHDQRAQGERS